MTSDQCSCCCHHGHDDILEVRLFDWLKMPGSRTEGLAVSVASLRGKYAVEVEGEVFVLAKISCGHCGRWGVRLSEAEAIRDGTARPPDHP